ncbi:hypothetical protein OG884_14580 [Streptosporangium sp. NBC_01755]|nr:hypothetical protein OG884_14580 [Streptosporangium sp. NBC_01755]
MRIPFPRVRPAQSLAGSGLAVLPRIPKVRNFRGYAEAGRKLADLHIHYEQAEPYKGIVEKVSGNAATSPHELYHVEKMKIPKTKGKADRSTIVYNNRMTLTNIPEEAYRYQLGARSAIEWIIDRYQIKVDKDSGIINDPNDWSDDPRYVIDLLKRIVTVSLETMKIVDHLPPLGILEWSLIREPAQRRSSLAPALPQPGCARGLMAIKNRVLLAFQEHSVSSGRASLTVS